MAQKTEKQRRAELEDRVRRNLLRIYTLTCIRDGGTIDFHDEGPFPVMDGKAVDQWAVRPGSGRRQNLLRQLRKRDDENFPVWAFAVRDEKTGEIVPISQKIDKKTGAPAFDANGVPVLEANGVVVTMPPPVWMMEHALEMPIPYANAQWVAKHKEHLAQRAENARQGKANMGASLEKAEADKVKATGAGAPA